MVGQTKELMNDWTNEWTKKQAILTNKLEKLHL